MFKIKNRLINKNTKSYFIADIAANHDGKLERAKKLISLAAKNGADAAKFQNFFAHTIVSDIGFGKLKKKLSHQKNWKKSVYEVYKAAETNLKWTERLKKTCENEGIDYFTAPYDLSIINKLNKFVCAWKVGSGDITWHELILKLAKKKKPIIIATGASNFKEIKEVYDKIININKNICIMQCNTNYTADIKNFRYINLNVIKTFEKYFKKAIIGLSDHTLGHETVLGAIALGARVIEKHFTDDNSRNGPDHKFSMNAQNWSKMIEYSRNLEISLGEKEKKVEKNEIFTRIIQRRGIMASRYIPKNKILQSNDLSYLRPCPNNALSPNKKDVLIGKKTLKNIKYHEFITLKKVK